jgi:hypothetical protein
VALKRASCGQEEEVVVVVLVLLLLLWCSNYFCNKQE